MGFFAEELSLLLSMLLNLKEEQLQEGLKDKKLNTFIEWYLNYMHANLCFYSFNWIITRATKLEEDYMLGKNWISIRN